MCMDELSNYRSPVSKLLPFFLRSRDNWKAKCKAAKRENKSLKTRLAKMAESRDRWKAKARGLQEELSAESTPIGKDSKKGLPQPAAARGGRRA
jgi:hypothetical protein